MTVLAHVLTHPVTQHLALQQPAPDWNAPGVNLARSFWAAGFAIGLLVCGTAIVGGGAAIAIGRSTAHGAMQKTGIAMLICGVIGAAVIGSAASITNWGRGIDF